MIMDVNIKSAPLAIGIGLCLFAGVLLSHAQYPQHAEVNGITGLIDGDDAVLLWQPASEHGTLGYRLFRLEGDVRVPLHEDLIYAALGQSGTEYRVLESGRKAGDFAQYQLEAVLFDGMSVILGTWDVSFVKLAPAIAVNVSQSDDGVRLAGDLPAPAARVSILTNDIYAVSFADVAAVLGFDPALIAELAEAYALVVLRGNEPVSYRADLPNERILFYGQAEKTSYARDTVYWIYPGDGMSMDVYAAETVAVDTNQAFMGTLNLEADLVHTVEHQSGAPLRQDPYCWTHIVAGSGTIGTRSFSATLPGYQGGDIALSAYLLGWSIAPPDGQHRADVRFNGALVGSMEFGGMLDGQAMFMVPEAVVLETNVVAVTGVNTGGVTTSIFMIDRFELTYAQDYGPRNQLLAANDGGHARLTGALFEAPVVLNISNPSHPLWVVGQTGNLQRTESWVVPTNSSWAFRENSAIPVLQPTGGKHGAWLLAPTNCIDYLVIAPRSFAAGASAFADYRATQGLRTAVAFFEDISDHFAGGRRSPEAIRALLKYADAEWVQPPWLVLLAGAGHYDYYCVQATRPNLIPSLLATDSIYLRPSDGLLGDRNDDGVPDIAIGRLPAIAESQLFDYLGKLKAYESAGAQRWHEQVFFVADNADAGGDFEATNLQMASGLTNRYAQRFSTFGNTNLATVRADIKAAFTNGSGIIHYTGHGTYQQLADENLLHTNDVSGLGGPPIPLFISLTCLIGRFDIPNTRSLSESLVLKPEGGALAVFAPSGLSWNPYASDFANQFYARHAGAGAEVLGPALLHARREIGAVSGLHGHAIRTYLLLGDPAIKLQGGAGGIDLPQTANVAHWRYEWFAYAEVTNAESSSVEGISPVSGSPYRLHYALGVDPDEPMPPIQMGVQQGERPALTWERRHGAEDALFRVLVSSNLVAWQELVLQPEVDEILVGGKRARIRAELENLADDFLFYKLELSF